MNLTINGVRSDLEGWKRAKLEKALLGSYNDMCDEMNKVVLPVYNHIWEFAMGHTTPNTWDASTRHEYEECENELSQDLWTHILQNKYGYRYVITNYYLTDLKRSVVGGKTVQVTCDLHVDLANAGE